MRKTKQNTKKNLSDLTTRYLSFKVNTEAESPLHFVIMTQFVMTNGSEI